MTGTLAKEFSASDATCTKFIIKILRCFNTSLRIETHLHIPLPRDPTGSVDLHRHAQRRYHNRMDLD